MRPDSCDGRNEQLRFERNAEPRGVYEPAGIAFRTGENKTVVALSSREESAFIHAGSRALASRIPVRAQDPRPIAVRNGLWYVAGGEKGQLIRVATGGPGRVSPTFDPFAMKPDGRRRLGAVLALAALFALGAAQRVWNLLYYPVEAGFDARGNWAYISMLIGHWKLPHPEAGWSTAHPPFFYAVSAAIGALLGEPGKQATTMAIVAISALIGLAAIGAVAAYVRRHSDGDDGRVLLSSGLLLFLPVHVYMSAMLSEEILATALVTFASIGLARELGRPKEEGLSALRLAWTGLVAGLGLLTKMSAVMVIVVGSVVLLAEGPKRGWKRSLGAAICFGGCASLAGGWFYLRNLALYGFLYPHGLEVHSVMSTLPPGSRTILDYLSFPLAAFRGVQASDPALLHSVWGSTWSSIWFDSHRYFLPMQAPGLEFAASTLLVLALVPTTAFVIGLARGVRRAIREGSGPDRLFVGLTVLLLCGFVAFTWRNPWYVTIKGSFLLGISAPYAIYAGEALRGWMRRDPWLRLALGLVLAALAAATLATFSYNAVFWRDRSFDPASRAVGTGWASALRDRVPDRPERPLVNPASNASRSAAGERGSGDAAISHHEEMILAGRPESEERLGVDPYVVV
jgi:hypothetical protein